jgi:hypothetical protein
MGKPGVPSTEQSAVVLGIELMVLRKTYRYMDKTVTEEQKHV